MSNPVACKAKDELLCPFHGIAFGFTEVPQSVEDNRERLNALKEIHEEEKAALDAYANSIGWSAKDVQEHWREDLAIETLYLSEREAYGAEHAERSNQWKVASKLAQKLVDEQFPEIASWNRKLLAELAGHTSHSAGMPGHVQRPVFRLYQGLTDEQRTKLFEIDRCYKLAFHGWIPSDDSLETIRTRRDEYFNMPFIWARQAQASSAS